MDDRGRMAPAPDLVLCRLRFDLESLESIELPPHKGDTLRMALLWWLSEQWCPRDDRCRPAGQDGGEPRWGCREPGVCLFGRLCEPVVNPKWSFGVRQLIGKNPPPAYALWDGQDRRGHIEAGSAWRFELTLVGEPAIRQLAAILAAVQQGAERGMGRLRWRSRLRRVTALAGDTGARVVAAEGLAGGRPALIWQSRPGAEITTGREDAAAYAAGFAGPVHSLRLSYLSPVKVKERGAWVGTPDFRPVMRAVVRRLRIMSEVHGPGEWPHTAYGALLDLAETVRLEHHETAASGYSRYSLRSGHQEVEGFVGQAWYGSPHDLRPLLPALWLGQWLHIGKFYVIGSGRYSLVAQP